MPQDSKQLNKYNMMLDQLADMYPDAEDEIQALQDKLADITPSDEDYEDEEMALEDDELPMPEDEDMLA